MTKYAGTLRVMGWLLDGRSVVGERGWYLVQWRKIDWGRLEWIKLS